VNEFWKPHKYVTFGLIPQNIRPDKGETIEARNEPGLRVYRESTTNAQVQIRGKRGKAQHLYASVGVGWAEARELRDYLTAMLREVGEDAPTHCHNCDCPVDVAIADPNDGEASKPSETEERDTAQEQLLVAARSALSMLSIAVEVGGGDPQTHVGCTSLRRAIEKAGRTA